MANISRPMGLVPHSYLNGSPWNGQTRQYFIPSTDGNAFAIGDPVKMGGSGDTKGVPDVTIAVAGATNPVLGVITGAGGSTYGGGSMIPGALETTVIPATKTRGYYVDVCDDPNVLYMVQEGGAGAALTQTSLWLNFNLASGTNNGYRSTWVLDNATGAADATYQLQLVRLLQAADNEMGTYAKWLVRINLHPWRGGVAGA